MSRSDLSVVFEIFLMGILLFIPRNDGHYEYELTVSPIEKSTYWISFHSDR